MLRDALTQEVQLPLPPFKKPLALRQLLRLALNGGMKPFYFFPEIRSLKVSPQRFQLVCPGGSFAADHRAVLVALRQTRRLAEVHFLAEARAGVSGRVADEGPAHGLLSLPEMVHMLFGGIGVVPDDLHMKPPGVIAFQPNDLHPSDALESVKHGTRAKTFKRIGPSDHARACSQRRGIRPRNRSAVAGGARRHVQMCRSVPS